MTGTLENYLLTRECVNTSYNVLTMMENVLKERLINTRNILVRMFTSIQKYKKENIITLTETTYVVDEINNLIKKITLIESKYTNALLTNDDIIVNLQELNDKISGLMKTNGASCLYDMIVICFGNDYLDTLDINTVKRLKILNETFHPISYKSILWSLLNRSGKKTPTVNSAFFEDIHICEDAQTMDIFPITKVKNDTLILKVHGSKIIFTNENSEQSLVIYGYFDDIPLEYLNTSFINDKINNLVINKPNTTDFQDYTFSIFTKSLTLRDILTYDELSLYDIFVGYKTFVKQINNKPLSKITREFMNNDLYEKRGTLLKLLLYKDDFDLQFTAYLLYDLLSIDDKQSESNEQTIIFESLPDEIKNNFRGAMKQTIEYTNKLSNLELQNSLPYEQRICLMKTKEYVKEKAMNKLKELKAKSEDSGSKARQYLDGLLKIPFGIYCSEPILEVMKKNIELYKRFVSANKEYDLISDNNLCSMEIVKLINNLIINTEHEDNIECSLKINELLEHIKRKEGYIEIINIINNNVDKYGVDKLVVNRYSNKNEMKDRIMEFIYTHHNETKLFLDILKNQKYIEFNHDNNEVSKQILEIKGNFNLAQNYLKNVNNTLSKSVHGHKNAKKQIERILGQWVNGEQTGYCFGFEGPPGVGKTSLAKHGLSNCLKDENGESRPFAFIAIGGSSNGSTLDGHNYTYVGSMWGKIVDILMETKCMNPIIFIDEIDKVSRTENGKEIIGILTHLIDPTQNNEFQDKYFTGIDLDLSKALFVFSYNDVELMDRILLDRIHRVKFEHLSLEDKVTICKDYMLPEIFTKMGQKNNIIFPDDVLEYIIEEYTCEAGVRKLKEVLFEIVGEINLEFIKDNVMIPLPFELTRDNIKNKYLKNRETIKPKKIPKESRIGVINGLWANSLGRGGIIPIETNFIISTNMLELKLTGMQGDVMKESMSVAKTLAWKLTDTERKEELIKEFEKTKTQGIHIHCPDGATPKDGPSAGTAITVTLYSLLNCRKIKNTVAITGEINLQGDVTAIGGLDLKILGGIQGGVKTFLFPVENEKDFKKFMEKNKENPVIEGIEFMSISSIEEALKLALE